MLANVTAGSTLQDLQGAPGNWAMEDLAIQPEGRQTRDSGRPDALV